MVINEDDAIKNLYKISNEIQQDSGDDATRFMWGSLASVFAIAALGTSETITSIIPDFNAVGQIVGVAAIGMAVYGVMGIMTFRHKMNNMQLSLLDDMRHDIYKHATPRDRFEKYTKESFKQHAIDHYNEQGENFHQTALKRTVNNYVQRAVGIWMLCNIALVGGVNIVEHYVTQNDDPALLSQPEPKP